MVNSEILVHFTLPREKKLGVDVNGRAVHTKEYPMML
jgi:hypothetical protein